MSTDHEEEQKRRTDARRRDDARAVARKRLADQNRLPELPEDASDLDILETASAISRNP